MVDISKETSSQWDYWGNLGHIYIPESQKEASAKPHIISYCVFTQYSGK